MRVALLTLNHFVCENSFGFIAQLMISRGHQVAAFYHPGEPPPKGPGVQFYPCEWWKQDRAALEEFNPDRILVFNGTFSWCWDAVLELKQRWRVLHAELAWLPQSHHLYIDPVGPGARSLLYETPTPPQVGDAAMIREQVAPYYTPTPLSTEAGYFLIPLQLEGDTSITWDSPRFKTMSSLVQFVQAAFPEKRIVVKPHPLEKNVPRLEGVFMVPPKNPIKDWIASADAVIGINSTSLIEASLIFKKPVMALGLNVASRRGVFYEGNEAFDQPRGFLEYQPDLKKLDQCLLFLHSLQFHRQTPPETVAELIEATDHFVPKIIAPSSQPDSK